MYIQEYYVENCLLKLQLMFHDFLHCFAFILALIWQPVIITLCKLFLFCTWKSQCVHERLQSQNKVWCYVGEYVTGSNLTSQQPESRSQSSQYILLIAMFFTRTCCSPPFLYMWFCHPLRIKLYQLSNFWLLFQDIQLFSLMFLYDIFIFTHIY